ncbi:MAG: LysR family transcriptional regulator [Rickettsiales bacterium]|nr:LysR family transcriptional regulator [Rickettsiales bacterium]
MNKNQNEFHYKKNRLQQIKGFYYTALLGSVSKASKIMEVNQSTVTLQIQSLERDMGITLLNRSSKPLTLTYEGKQFYEIAGPLMKNFESIVENFLSHKNSVNSRKVSIAVHGLMASSISNIVANFIRQDSINLINISFINLNSAIEALKNNQIDLIFYPKLIKRDNWINYIDSASFEPILIANKNNNNLNDSEITSITELENLDIIKIKNDDLENQLISQYLKSDNKKFIIELENSNIEAIKSLIANNKNLVGIDCKINLKLFEDNFICKSLKNIFGNISFCFMTNRNQPMKQTTSDFIEFANNYFANNQIATNSENLN